MAGRRARVAAGGAAAALWIASVAAAAPAPDEQREFADGLYARGLYELAIREYMALLRAVPNYDKLDQVLYRLAESYRETDNPAAADLFYRRVIAEHPASPFRLRAELRRAELFIAVGQPADAASLLRALLSISPPPDIESGARFFLGVAAAMTNGAAEAEAEFRRVMASFESSPYYTLAAMELAGLRRKAGAPASDIYGLYRAAAARAPSTNLAAEAWLRMGDLAYAVTNHDVAVEAYGRLLKEFPAHPRAAEARLQAAWSFYHAGRPADALTIAAEAVQRAGDTDEWLYLTANCRRKLLDTDGAVEAYETLLRRFPDSRLAAAAAFESATVLFRQRRYEAVIERLGRRAWEGALRSEADWLLAESHIHAGTTNMAVQHYRRLADLDPPSPRTPDAMYRLGAMLVAGGQRAEGAEILGAMAERHPQHALAAAALFESGLAHAADQRWEEAVAAWGRLERDYGASPLVEEGLFQKGLAEIRLKRVAAAGESLSRLLKRFPSTAQAAEARFWLGALAEQAGEAAAAEEEYRRALALEPAPELRRRARFRLAGVLRKLGKSAEAADLLQELLATPTREEMSPALVEWLAATRLEQKAFAQAADAAAALLAVAPDEPWKQIAAHMAGRAQLGLGARAAAIRMFEQAAAGDAVTRARIEALLDLGRLYLEDNNADKASERYRLAAELASDDQLGEQRARALYGLGCVAVLTGDLDSASRYFLSVAVLYDHPALSPESLYRAAGILDQLKQPDHAARLRAELKERYPTSEWATKP